MLCFRPEAEMIEFLWYVDAGYRPGCMMLRIHHAEISLDSEAYRDGLSCLLPVTSWPRRDVTVLHSNILFQMIMKYKRSKKISCYVLIYIFSDI